jgi:hexokinase
MPFLIVTAWTLISLSPIIDYLAESVDAFLTKHATTEYTSPGDDPRAAAADTKTVHLGFTFSFPVEQSAIDSGKLLTWTKGFNVKGVVGQDVVKLLQDAFDRKHMNVRCVALVNDVRASLHLEFILAIKIYIVLSFTDCRHSPVAFLHGRWLRCWMHLWDRDQRCICRASWYVPF